MVDAGGEVDGQAAVGHFNISGGHIKRCVATDHVEDVEIFDNRFAFNRHIKYPCALLFPAQLRHLQGDVVSAIGNGQLISKSTPAPALVKRAVIGV